MINKILKRALPGLLGIGVLFPVLSVAVEVSEETRFYQVYAQTPEHLLVSLNNSSPIRINGSVYYGYTYNKIDWQFWHKTNHQRCWITHVNVELKTQFTLPQLVGGTNEVKMVWDDWYPKLVNHEKHHQKIGIDIAQQIERAIRKLPQQANCELLTKKVNQIGNRALGKMLVSHKLYDQKTDHGASEGASISALIKSRKQNL